MMLRTEALLLFIKSSISDPITFSVMSAQKDFKEAMDTNFLNIINMNKRINSIKTDLGDIKELVDVYPKYVRAFNDFKNAFNNDSFHQDIGNKYKPMFNFINQLKIIEQLQIKKSNFSHLNFKDTLIPVVKQKQKYQELEREFYKMQTAKIK